MTNRIRHLNKHLRRLQPEVRWSLIRSVRREIARGEYESEDKWRVAVDRLLERLPR